jgi:hypothetical protein
MTVSGNMTATIQCELQRDCKRAEQQEPRIGRDGDNLQPISRNSTAFNMSAISVQNSWT